MPDSGTVVGLKHSGVHWRIARLAQTTLDTVVRDCLGSAALVVITTVACSSQLYARAATKAEASDKSRERSKSKQKQGGP